MPNVRGAARRGSRRRRHRGGARRRRAGDRGLRGTGRAGVCVDRVEIVEEIDWLPTDVSGVYRASKPLGRVYVEPAGTRTRQSVLHELCHALDLDEAITMDHSDLFPPDPRMDRDAYPTDVDRRREAFARVCATGPDDPGLALALEEACGVDLLDEQDRFMTREIFLGDAVVPVSVDSVGVPTEGPGFELELPRHAHALALLADDDGFVLLTGSIVYKDGDLLASYATISRIALPSGEVVGSWQVNAPGGLYGAGLYPRDAGPILLWVMDGTLATRVLTLDEASGRFSEPALESPIPWSGGVVSQGVFWYVSQAGDAEALRGVRLDGGSPVEAPELDGLDLYLRTASPGGDALVASTPDGHLLLDLAAGAASRIEEPGGHFDFLGWLDDERLLFRARARVGDGFVGPKSYVAHDRAADTWSLVASSCDDSDEPYTILGGGGAWTVRGETTESGQQRLSFRPLTFTDP